MSDSQGRGMENNHKEDAAAVETLQHAVVPEAENYSAEKLPLFSVIVLAYQQQNVINACIESVLTQNYPNMELIVCDGGSLDYDEQMIRRLIGKNEKKLHRLVLYHASHNIGVVQTAQQGLDLAEGEYLKFLSADDSLADPGVLMRMAALFSTSEAQAVSSRSRASTYEGEELEQYYPASSLVSWFSETDADEQLALLATHQPMTLIWSAGMFFRRSALVAIGGFDCSYVRNLYYPVALRLLEKGYRFTVSKDITTIYRYGGTYNSGNEEAVTALAKEQIRAIEEIAIPLFHRRGEKSRVMRCQYNMWCIRTRLVKDYEWPYMSIWQKLAWRWINQKQFGIAWLYNVYENGIYVSHKASLYAAAASLLFYWFHVEIVPGQSFDRFWSICFVTALGITLIKYAFLFGIQLMIGTIKTIRGRS